MTAQSEPMAAVIDPSIARTLAPAQPKRAPLPYSPGWVVALLISDVTMFLGSAALAEHLVFPHGRFFVWSPVLVSSLIDIVIWIAIFQRVGLYRRSFALSVKDEFYFTVAGLCLGVAPQMIVFTIAPQISTSRLVLLLSLALSVVTVGCARTVAHALRDIAGRSRPRRICVVGHPDRIAVASKSLNLVEGTEILTLPVDDVDSGFESINLTHDPELDQIAWFHRAKTWGCDTLVITEMLPPESLPHLLEVAGRYHMSVAFAPPRFRAQAYSLTLRTDGHQALIVPSPLAACTPSARLFKRVFDVLAASSALVLASPFMALATLAIYFEDGRPIFYRQARVGRNGKIFELLKFRSMIVDAERTTGPVWSAGRDPRTTRVGAVLRRTSIDELPQLFNVLRGDMSIVGPRPERPEFVDVFRSVLPRYDERHLVRPGITGWSQVTMKRVLETSDVGEKLSNDLFYLEHWSFFLDISVVVKTAAEFLFHFRS